MILLVLAVALGAYYYLVEADRDPLADDVRERVFAGVEPGSIEEVEVRAESGEVTRARKTDGDWAIVEPAPIDADVAAVSGLATTLETLEIQRTVDENPAELGPFGLETPRFSVAFRAAGDTAMRRLEVGDRTPTGGDLYARVEGQPALVLIAGYLEDSLNKSTFDLRDKTVLHIARDVDRLRLAGPSATALEAVRDENDWRLAAPVAARADFAAIDGLIRRILEAEMRSIAADDTEDLEQYGLATPRAVATLGTGSAQAALEIGAAADDATVYARDTSRPMVFTLDTAVLDELSPEVDDLRMKDVFQFRSFNALGLVVTLDGETYTFAKEAPAPAEGAEQTASQAPVWTLTAPERREVDQATMSGLLTSLSNLRAESFADRPLASGDEVVVTARFGDDAAPSQEALTFRRSGDTVHAIVPGEPGAAVVPATDFDAALVVIRQLIEGQ